MKKKILPLIFASACLITTPAYAAESVDAIVPVSCTAKGSTENFTVSIEGDGGYKSSPETLSLEDGESKYFTISIDTPGEYKYKIYQKKGTEENTEYDKTVYQAEVFVTEDNDGNLSTDTVVFIDGSKEKSAKCEFVNKVTKDEDNTTNSGSQDGSGGSTASISNGGGGTATAKGDISGTARVKTGVETNELLYAGIGMAGMLTAAIVVKKKNRKTKR